MPFTKNLRGVCEQDNYGRYLTVEDCLASNQVWFDREIDREITLTVVEFDFERVFKLAPSDRSRVLQGLYGLQVPPGASYDVAESIYTNNLARLYYRYHGITEPYWSVRLDEYDVLLLELLEPMGERFEGYGTPMNLRAIRRNIDSELNEIWNPDVGELTINDYMEALIGIMESLNIGGIHAGIRADWHAFVTAHWEEIRSRYL